MNRKIILFELNEVPWRIMERFCDWRPDSHLSKVLPTSRCYRTCAEDGGELSPWITWPSLHRGVAKEKHTITNFGQQLSEIDAVYPPIWKILKRHGISTGVCGSLHSWPLPEDAEEYAFFIPDTFAAGNEAFPPSIGSFQEFNRRMVDASPRNVSTGIPWRSSFRVLANAHDLGLRPGTLASIGSHLLSERTRKWKKTRRRSFQTVLAFDIFMKLLRSTRPAFTTFFTNHVASAMHRYWAATFPDDYDDFGYDADWVETYRHEIGWTMSRFDVFLGRLLDFVGQDDEYTLFVATSMGQAATSGQPARDAVYLVDVEKFMAGLKFQPSEWTRRPAMAPRVSLVVDEGKKAVLRTALESLHIGNESVTFEERKGGFFNIHIDQSNLEGTSDMARFLGQQVPFDDIGLERVRVEDQAGQSAYHIPEGCLFVFDPKQRLPCSGRPEISTLDIAPAILKNFGIAAPSYMREPARTLIRS